MAVEEGAVTLSEMYSEGLTVNRSLFLLLLFVTEDFISARVIFDSFFK